jgi:hypothetical protein
MDDVGERMRRSRFFAPSKWLVLQNERRSKRSLIGEVIIEIIMVSDKVWALIINLDSTSAIGRSPATAMPDFSTRADAVFSCTSNPLAGALSKVLSSLGKFNYIIPLISVYFS